MASASPKKKRQDKVIVHLLVIALGVTSWSIMNGLWVELPILVTQLPEGWTLPSLLTIISQFGNLGPLCFVFLSWLFPTTKLETPVSVAVVIALTCCATLYAFLWKQTAIVGGEYMSLALLALTLCQSIFAATSSMSYLAFMSHLKASYISSIFIGQGLSGLIPAFIAIGQGAGDIRCVKNMSVAMTNSQLWTNITEVNNSSNLTNGQLHDVVPVNTEPRFSVMTFFLILASLGIMSLVSLLVLVRHPYCKTEHVDVESEEKHSLLGAKGNSSADGQKRSRENNEVNNDMDDPQDLTKEDENQSNESIQRYVQQTRNHVDHNAKDSNTTFTVDRVQTSTKHHSEDALYFYSTSNSPNQLYKDDIITNNGLNSISSSNTSLQNNINNDNQNLFENNRIALKDSSIVLEKSNMNLDNEFHQSLNNSDSDFNTNKNTFELVRTKSSSNYNININTNKDNSATETTVSGLDKTTSDGFEPSSDGSEKERLANWESWYLLALLVWINVLQTSYVLAIQVYSSLPYGLHIYNGVTKAENIIDPLACCVTLFVTAQRIKVISGLTLLGTLFAAYIITVAAMSPNPILVEETIGGILVIAAWVMCTAIMVFSKVSIAAVMRTQGRKSLIWTAGSSQTGALIGAVLAYVMINQLQLFKDGPWC